MVESKSNSKYSIHHIPPLFSLVDVQVTGSFMSRARIRVEL